MKAIPLAENIWWVGAIDWNAHHFHGQTFTTKRGTTYNAYLIVDEKITLIDTVYGPFAEEMLQRIRSVIPPEKIDTLIALVENDKSHKAKEEEEEEEIEVQEDEEDFNIEPTYEAN